MPTKIDNQSLTDMQANELSNAQAAEYGRFTVLHDAAGNLTRDHRGYEYEYDYENRMILVKKPLGAGFVAVATFEYDALGRRIEKVDAIAGTTTRYYYDDQRVAVQTLVSGGVETDDRYFVFGNYIDETLVMHVIPAQAGTQDLYYAHDHLYSPVALFAANGTVAERYEYDAYGKCQILNSEFLILNSSQHGNPYAFTGRELDTLDAGRRTLMYYRARTYDPETGRFMQRDPLGMSIFQLKKMFKPAVQYNDGMNIYEYVRSKPNMITDPAGLSGYYPLPLPNLPPPNNFPWKGDDFWSHYYTGVGRTVDLGEVGLLEGFRERLSGDIAGINNTIETMAGGKAIFLPCKWGDIRVNSRLDGHLTKGIHTLDDGPIDVIGGYFNDPYFLIGGVTLRVDYSCKLSKFCCKFFCYSYDCQLDFSLPTEFFSDVLDPFDLFPGDQDLVDGTPFRITASWSDILKGSGCL